MAGNELDPGFDEVLLDEGFEEVPVQVSAAPVVPASSVEDAKSVLQGVTFNPLTLGYGAAKTGLSALQKAIKGEKQDILGDLQQNTQQGQDFIAGGMQGALLGGEDELAGLASAGAAKLAGSPKSFFDLYREGQKSAEGAFDAAEARNPKMFAGGEITGAVGAGLATGGLGVEAGLARGMGSVGVKQAAKSGVGSALKEVGKQAVAAGTEGAILGGVQSGLSSENTLDNASELGKDVASGATFGGLFSGGIKAAQGAIPMAGELGSKAVKAPVDYASSKSVHADQMRTIWNRVREGLPVDYEDLRLAGELEGVENDVLNKFYNARKNIGTKLDQAYQAADRMGTKVNIMNPLDQAESGFLAFAENSPALNFQGRPEYKKILNRIFSVKGTELSPTQAKILAQEIGDEAAKLKNPQMSQIASDFSKSVRGSLEQSVPEAAELSKQYYNLNKYGLETLAGKGKVNPRDIKGFVSSDPIKDRQSIQWLLKRITTPGTSQEEVSNAMHYMKSGLSKLERESPGVFKALGIKNIDELDNMIRDKSKLFSIANVLQGRSGVGEPISSNPIKMLAQGASSILTKGLYTGAKYGAKAANVAMKPVDFGRAVTSLPEEELTKVAQTLLNDKSKGSQSMGQFLMNAVQNKDSVQRNAALFTIQQNPKYRNLIKNQYFGEQDQSMEGEGNE